MIIYLVRHGQKIFNPDNPGLTEFGLKQAELTANFFRDKRINKIICSPYQRTLQTAQLIAQVINRKLITSIDLRERAEWTDKLSFQEFVDIWMKASSERSWQPPIGDSSIGAGARIAKVINQNLSTDNLTLVTHGGAVTDFLRNISSDDYLINNYFGTFENLRDTIVPNCSITQIERHKNDFKIIDLFSTAHLVDPSC